jgi:oxygen-dependent protoporphyrinogen oxidase
MSAEGGTVTDVAVIGGGIAGLAAAWELTRGTPGSRVTLIEASGRLGGKIETAPFAGVELDGGPDAFLARVPAATQLAREAGLGDDLVAPGTGQAWLWARGRLRRLPTGLVLGVPVDLRALARSAVLPLPAAARAALDLVLPGSPVGPDEDVAVGPLVRRRMGRAVQEGLVDPLLGGINAGHTDHLSAAVAAPQLVAAARTQASLIRALRAAGTGGSASGAITTAAPAVADSAGLSAVDDDGPGRQPPAAHPVFLTVRGGLARLVDAVAAGLTASGCTVVVGDAVAELTQAEQGWTVRLASGREIAARGVVVACPAPAAATLLRPTSPGAAAELAAIATASVALVSLAYPSEGQPGWEGSGFLVPRGERRLITAASWVGQKWPHLAVPGRVLVRASAGRIDDERIATFDDDELADAVHRDVAGAMGLRGRPVERRVNRWPAAFPQYEVGHLARIDRLERRLATDAPGLAVAGAALRGVGLATCIAGGRAAAARVRSHLATSKA